MKVFFDHRIFLLQKYGGISKYISKLNQYLAYKNVNSIIVSPISINAYLEKKKENEIVHLRFKKVYKYCNKIFNFYNNSISDLYIRGFKPDIIHRSYYKPGYSSTYKHNKIPTVVTVYDLIHEKMYNPKPNNKWKEKYLNEADHIICISKKTQSDLLELFNISKNKTSVVHLGTDIGVTQASQNKSIYTFQKKFLLYVGDRKRYKNFKLFIKAYNNSKILKNEFDIVCCGPENFSKNENLFFKDYKIDTSKIRHINASDDELIYIYKKASSLIFLLKYEGYGLPAIDAMSLDCPVIASDIDVFKEILSDKAVYFNPNDLDDIKKTLENTLLSKNKLEKMSNEGIIHSKNYNWKQCADETLNIYKKII